MRLRVALPRVVDKSLALVNHLRSGDKSTVHNMDRLLLRLSMDIIGASGSLPLSRKCSLAVTLLSTADANNNVPRMQVLRPSCW